MKQEAMRQLALQVAAVTGIKAGRPRRLKVVGQEPPPALSALQRDVLYSRIRDLGNMYWLNWLIRQETAHTYGVLECLGDDELETLFKKMERAREARIEGVPFDEIGLIRGTGSG